MPSWPALILHFIKRLYCDSPFLGSLILSLFAFCPVVVLSPVLHLNEAGINSEILEWTECSLPSPRGWQDPYWGGPKGSTPHANPSITNQFSWPLGYLCKNPESRNDSETSWQRCTYFSELILLERIAILCFILNMNESLKISPRSISGRYIYFPHPWPWEKSKHLELKITLL